MEELLFFSGSKEIYFQNLKLINFMARFTILSYWFLGQQF
jgi:hypothetical protein